jgi:hypothetical protein
VNYCLGTNTVVEDVTVIWPGNATQKVANAQVDRVNGVRQE